MFPYSSTVLMFPSRSSSPKTCHASSNSIPFRLAPALSSVCCSRLTSRCNRRINGGRVPHGRPQQAQQHHHHHQQQQPVYGGEYQVLLIIPTDFHYCLHSSHRTTSTKKERRPRFAAPRCRRRTVTGRFLPHGWAIALDTFEHRIKVSI